MKNFAEAEEQVVEKCQERDRHEDLEERGLVGRDLGVDGFHVDPHEDEDPDDHDTDEDDDALDEIGADDRVEAAEEGVDDADEEDCRHAVGVGNAGESLEKITAGHRHADEPGHRIDQRNDEENAPRRFAKPQADKVAARVALRH